MIKIPEKMWQDWDHLNSAIENLLEGPHPCLEIAYPISSLNRSLNSYINSFKQMHPHVHIAKAWGAGMDQEVAAKSASERSQENANLAAEVDSVITSLFYYENEEVKGITHYCMILTVSFKKAA